jgi:hypothetical protein
MARTTIPKKSKVRYDIVQGKTPEELVRLVNLKTRFGWEIAGGMTYVPDNIDKITKELYPYCQSVIKK